MSGTEHRGQPRGFSTSGSILIGVTGLFIAFWRLCTVTANTGERMAGVADTATVEVVS
jgi:hypothetical protein